MHNGCSTLFNCPTLPVQIINHSAHLGHSNQFVRARAFVWSWRKRATITLLRKNIYERHECIDHQHHTKTCHWIRAIVESRTVLQPLSWTWSDMNCRDHGHKTPRTRHSHPWRCDDQHSVPETFLTTFRSAAARRTYLVWCLRYSSEKDGNPDTWEPKPPW